MTVTEVVDTAVADDRGVSLPASTEGVLTVSLDGRYVWAFSPGRDGARLGDRLVVGWPPALRPHLRGSTRLTVADHHDGRVYLDTEVVLGDASAGRIRVEDALGHPLAVNKVGNLTRVFSETDDGSRREILEGTTRVLADLRGPGGVQAYLNYGCLLGAVREGAMIGTDCDADLCYLSDRTTPVDVIAESYRLERTMLGRGWETVRMSGGDFKVLLRLGDGRTCYVDVFVAFCVEGRFFQLGNRSGQLPREAVVPTSTVVIEGVELPAPADPEAMLAFVYGDGWRVPDPAFRFSDPAEGVRRLDGWLRGFRDEVPGWNLLFRTRAQDVPRGPSSFARWARDRIPAGDTVADLGCGRGRDAAFFARHGHPVLAYDVSPDARRATQQRLRRSGTPAGAASAVRRMVLGELRTVALTGAEIASAPGRAHVYARGLVGCVDGEARRNLWRLARTALRGSGGSLFLELATKPPNLPVRPAGLVRRLDADLVLRELAAYGGRVLDRDDGPGEDLFGEHDPSTCRLQVTFDPLPQEAPVPGPTSSVARARRVVLRLHRTRGVHARLQQLEAELQENRRLNRRLAELTDLVTELLVPLARHDDAATEEVLERYRSSL